MRTLRMVQALVLSGAMLAPLAVPAVAQQGYYNGVRRGSGYNDRDDRRYADKHHRGDQRYQQGGIGPGKGALIGGAGGAALGALFGGGLKGAIIGGAAGAGVGAVAGKVHQDNQRQDYRDYRR
ncbi:hypothetical protein [Granulicella sp. dw_53]|uniref:hypothetical protein n=1 Tax=Granulicella sp. dw_53 TaxID=2719792 RepID=UPI001BD479FA|nr:hypothetical protein [Granulicella sp. dw_53]